MAQFENPNAGAYDPRVASTNASWIRNSGQTQFSTMDQVQQWLQNVGNWREPGTWHDTVLQAAPYVMLGGAGIQAALAGGAAGAGAGAAGAAGEAGTAASAGAIASPVSAGGAMYSTPLAIDGVAGTGAGVGASMGAGTAAGAGVAGASGASSLAPVYSAAIGAPSGASGIAAGVAGAAGPAGVGTTGVLGSLAGALGGSVGQYAQLLTSLYGVYQGNQMMDLAKNADSFGPYRAQYAGMLQQLMADPSSVSKLPGYEAEMKAGETALQRNLAAQGLTGSGTAASALVDYGARYQADAFGRYEQMLAQLAGAGSSGANGAMAGTAAGYSAINNSLNNLMKIWGANGG